MTSKKLMLLGAAVVVAGPFSRPARADDIDFVGQRLVELEAQIRELDTQLKPPEQTADAITRKLIDGQVLYELKNYEGAATKFFDIVDKYPTSPEFPEALYDLADSLYQKRDFLSAHRYFEKCVDLGPADRHYQAALERLIELSLYTGDYGPVDNYLAKLGSAEVGQKGPAAAVPYVRGKYYFFRKRYDDAIASLAVVPRDNQYWAQSQYFIGASHVGAGRMGDAITTFDPLSRAEVKTDAERKIVELAHLALGRVYYNEGQLASASIEYGKISQASDLYPDALYESAWVSIKDKYYQKAHRSLDLLLTAQPVGPQVPEVKLLMGNLQIRQNDFDDASKSFAKTRDEFESVKRDIDATPAAKATSNQYFQDLLTKNLGKFDIASLVPASAAKWLAKDPELDRLTAVLGDQGDVRSVLTESDEIIAKIEKALDGPKRVNIFPDLATARTRALETANQLVDQQNILIKAQRRLLDSVLGDDKASLEALAKQREALEKQLANLPRDKDAYQDRIQKTRTQFDGLDKRVVEINVLVQSYVAERVAIEKYFRDAGEGAPGFADKKALYDQQMAEALQQEKTLLAEEDALRKEIADQVQAVGVDDVQMQHESFLKDQLQQLLSREHAILTQVRDRLSSPDSRAKADRVESLLDRIRGDNDVIGGYNARIDQQVDARLVDVRSVLDGEKKNFGGYKLTLAAQRGDSSTVGGEIVAQSFHNISDRFYQLVVRADVGIIDVAWAQKQSRTDENSRLVREKKRELKLLDDDFKDVLKE